MPIVAIMVFAFVATVTAIGVGQAIWRSIEEFFMTFFLGAISGFISVLLTMLIYLILGSFVGEQPIRQTSSWNAKIIATSDNTLSSGRFYLFGGRFNEEPMYFYYYQTDDGGIHQFHVPVDRSVIYEDSEPNASHVTIINKDQETWGNWWFKERNFDKNGQFYVFHVPPGSVKRDISFDGGGN